MVAREWEEALSLVALAANQAESAGRLTATLKATPALALPVDPTAATELKGSSGGAGCAARATFLSRTGQTRFTAAAITRAALDPTLGAEWVNAEPCLTAEPLVTRTTDTTGAARCTCRTGGGADPRHTLTRRTVRCRVTATAELAVAGGAEAHRVDKETASGDATLHRALAFAGAAELSNPAGDIAETGAATFKALIATSACVAREARRPDEVSLAGRLCVGVTVADVSA